MILGLSIIAHQLLLIIAGFAAGLVAGLLGLGGGVLIVPILWEFGYTPVQAAATSSLAIVITASSGTLQNIRSGQLRLHSILGLALPALATAQVGALAANQVAPWILPGAFGILLWITIYLVDLRRRLAQKALASESVAGEHAPRQASWSIRLGTGGLAGLMAGFFGVGGGVILVPLQLLLLGESLKTAIQTSLAVIVVTSLSAVTGHALAGNVVFSAGLLMGFGGLVGVQISARFLPRLPDRVISLLFRGMLVALSINSFWRAWQEWLLGS